MREYDRVGTHWVPYLMQTVYALRNFPSVSTDLWGFRNTVARGGLIVSAASLSDVPETSPIGVLLGNSTAFGIGATHDRHTIPSALNRLTETTWLNYAGRAFNSTQEVIVLSLHLPRRLDQLVVFSGANNVFFPFVTQTSAVYNSMWSQSVFEAAISGGTHTGVRKAFRRLLKELRHRFRPAHEPPFSQSWSKAYDDMLTCFRRDLRVLRLLADGFGVPLHFALQPLATWMDKPLSSEEEQLFRVLDSSTIKAYQIWAKQMAAVKDSYFADIEQICRELSVNYCNMNIASELLSDDWLFVDRIHLTDRGYELAANVLKREFGL